MQTNILKPLASPSWTQPSVRLTHNGALTSVECHKMNICLAALWVRLKSEATVPPRNVSILQQIMVFAFGIWCALEFNYALWLLLTSAPDLISILKWFLKTLHAPLNARGEMWKPFEILRPGGVVGGCIQGRLSG